MKNFPDNRNDGENDSENTSATVEETEEAAAVEAEEAAEKAEAAAVEEALEGDHSLLDSVQSLLTIIVIAVFILTFIAQPFRIPSASMEPTLLIGDFLLVNKQVFAPAGHIWKWLLPYEEVEQKDVIVFRYPVDSSIHLVKRVVAVPGDHLHLEHGLVFIDGEQLHEPYAIYRPTHPDAYRDNFPSQRESDAGIQPQWWTEMNQYVHGGELSIPPRRYFAMGDNRNDSEDSRYWGFVPRDNIVGQPLLIYFSLRDAADDRAALSQSPGASPQLSRVPARKGLIAFLMGGLEGIARWDRSFSIVH